MKTEEARPKGFVVYRHSLKCALVLSDEGTGRVFKAAARYFLEGTEPENVGGFDCAEQIVYSVMRDDIDESMRKHQETVARSRERQKHHHSDASPLVTTCDNS